jgi:hypothetical protein
MQQLNYWFLKKKWMTDSLRHYLWPSQPKRFLVLCCLTALLYTTYTSGGVCRDVQHVGRHEAQHALWQVGRIRLTRCNYEHVLQIWTVCNTEFLDASAVLHVAYLWLWSALNTDTAKHKGIRIGEKMSGTFAWEAPVTWAKIKFATSSILQNIRANFLTKM